MKKNLLKKTLVVGIIVLFFGISMQPITSSDITQEGDIEQVDEFEQAKDYLFQTIIDIANNPDVKDLLEQVKNDGGAISCDYNFRNVFLKLLFRNPMLFRSLIFTKPCMTHEYLDTSYDRGYEIINVLGEEEVIAMIESVTITNPEFFDELNIIIMNNEELSNKITVLTEMNEVLKPNAPFEDYPIICAILAIIMLPMATVATFFVVLSEQFENNPIFLLIFVYPWWSILSIFFMPLLYIFIFVLGCLPY